MQLSLKKVLTFARTNPHNLGGENELTKNLTKKDVVAAHGLNDLNIPHRISFFNNNIIN